MKNRLLVTALLVAAFVFGAAINRAHTTSSAHQPEIVATLNMRGITHGIAARTIFTPAVTSVYRASIYTAVTIPGGGKGVWYLSMGWTDEVGPEESPQLVAMFDASTPPNAFGLSPLGALPAPSFIFEAVAGQPVNFNLLPPQDDNPGACALSITVERLQ